MTDNNKEKCRKAYYHTDIEPALDRLHQVKEIVSNFEKEGADRLMSALKMKHMDLEEIECSELICIFALMIRLT